MRKLYTFLLACALALGFTAVSITPAAHAAATPVATFTRSVSDVVAGEPVTFDATGSSSCYTGRCQWSWTHRTAGGQTLTGGQMGEGTVITYTFSATAATYPYVTVVLKVTAPGGTNNYRTAQQSFVVAAPAPPSPPP